MSYISPLFQNGSKHPDIDFLCECPTKTLYRKKIADAKRGDYLQQFQICRCSKPPSQPPPVTTAVARGEEPGESKKTL